MVHQVAAHGSVILKLHLDRTELEKRSKELCMDLLPGWAGVRPEAIQVSEISGGITNVLWKLQPKESSLDAVVLRIFGEQTDKIIDRNQEKRALGPLNHAGFGAQVLATFENGRIEEFLHMRPLKPEEMAERPMAELIAQRLKEFHGIEVGATTESQLFTTIEKWLDQAETLDFGSDREKKKAHEKLDFDRMKDAISAVKKLSKKLDPSSCFSHNDLLSGNILVPVHHDGCPQSPQVQFIDFEYSGYSYSSFDIANHFCEYAGFECDYSRFPKDEDINHFMLYYMFGGDADHAEQLLLRKGTVECKLLALAAHQFWGTWAILQAKYSPIDFDYMEYSKMRWDECFHREDEFLAQAETWLHQNKS